jgi:flagellum-specific peptidoglycan hydrolase FlgJ
MTVQEDFISKTVEDAKKIQREYNVLPSLTLAQAILESDWGRSALSAEHNNFFGIKGSGDAGSVTLPTTEYENGKAVKVDAAFAKYSSPYECFKRRALLFVNGVSWDKNKYRNLLGVMDYKLACRLIQKDGYATDPSYANKLIGIIESWKLYQYDQQGPQVSGVVKVICKALNLRSAASFDAPVVRVLHQGETYRCYGEENGLYNLGGGYCSANPKYVSFTHA